MNNVLHIIKFNECIQAVVNWIVSFIFWLNTSITNLVLYTCLSLRTSSTWWSADSNSAAVDAQVLRWHKKLRKIRASFYQMCVVTMIQYMRLKLLEIASVKCAGTTGNKNNRETKVKTESESTRKRTRTREGTRERRTSTRYSHLLLKFLVLS